MQFSLFIETYNSDHSV